MLTGRNRPYSLPVNSIFCLWLVTHQGICPSGIKSWAAWSQNKKAESPNRTKKQAIIRDSTIKVLDFQYTQTRKDTMEELYRVHFPDWKVIDNPEDGQGQPCLDSQTCKTIIDDREPVQKSDQSKNRWAIITFKQFKSAEIAEAMRTAPTDASEVLLGLPHLHV